MQPTGFGSADYYKKPTIISVMRKHTTLLLSALLTVSTAIAGGPAAKLSQHSTGSAVPARAAATTSNSLSTVKFKKFGDTRTAGRISIEGARRAMSSAPRLHAPARAAAVIPELSGCVTYSTAWGEEDKSGIYVIPNGTIQDFTLKIPDVSCISGVEVNGSYYWMLGYDFGFFQMATGGVWNLETGKSEWSSSLDSYSDMAVDMAFDKSQSWPLVYGLTSNGAKLSYFQFNSSENAITAYPVADLDVPCM